MKKQITLFILLLFSLLTFAQQDEIPEYLQYEKLTKKVNDIQRTANGKRIKGEGLDAQLAVPEINFIFNYHNLSTSWVSGNGEGVREIVENMDLAGVNDVFLSENQFGEVGCVIVSFSKKQKYTLINNGKITHQEIESIPFYFSLAERLKGKAIFDAIAELVYLSKVKKRLLTAQQAKQHQEKWKMTMSKNTEVAYTDFLRDVPNSLFGRMASANVEYFRQMTLASTNILRLDKLVTDGIYTYEDLDKLRTSIKHYLETYGAVDVAKSKGIQDISSKLVSYPKSKQEFDEKAERERKIAEKKRKKERFDFGGFGYYAGVKSPLGFSFIGGGSKLGFGVDLRIHPGWKEKATFEENIAPSVFTQKKPRSFAALVTMTHGIVYPFYAFVGAGYGSRTADYEVDPSLGINDNKLTVVESKGIETHGGLLIKAGRAFVFRAGISVNNFKPSTKEFVFGFIFSYL